ncbi:MAG: L,D-transpeptidase [Cyanobacteria bacterium J06638_6]
MSRPLGLILAMALWLPTLATGARASSPYQPVDIHVESLGLQSTSAAPLPSPQSVDDPTLYLPVPSRRVSRLVLHLSERRLYAYQGDREVASYPVAVGRESWETPTGEFTVFQRQQDPAWEHPLTGAIVAPGPDNPLGARWLGFWTDGTNAIGFHGTPDEHLIGEAVSHGCVRMRNADVIELYDHVELGTRVIVLP